MGLIDYLSYLKDYFRKESTNPTGSAYPKSVEDCIIKTESNPNNPNSMLVHIRTIDNKVMIYSIPKHTISERIIREREICSA